MINNTIKLNNVRLSYPALFEKKQWDQDKKPAYEATFILDKVKHANEIKIINEHIDRVLAENKTTRAKIQANHMCLKDGDTTDREEYQGAYTLKSKSYIRFPVVGRDAKPIEDEDRDKFYGGCYVNTCVQLGYYDDKAKGVNAKLRSVQYRSEGEPFGEAPQNIEGVYDVIPEEEGNEYF